jgi:hypothetical protein
MESHNRMVTETRRKGKIDLSRDVLLAAADTPVAGLDDRAVPQDSAGSDDSRYAVVRAGLLSGRQGCNNAARDRNDDKSRTPRDILACGKPAAAERSRQEPPCLPAGVDKGNPTMAVWYQLSKVTCTRLPSQNPAVASDGVLSNPSPP